MGKIMDGFMRQKKINEELEKFDVNAITNLVAEFIYDHDLVDDYRNCITNVNYWAMIVNSPAPTGKWELVHEIENLINAKNDMIFDLLDSDRVPKPDKDEFNNKFDKLVRPLYNAVYDL